MKEVIGQLILSAFVSLVVVMAFIYSAGLEVERKEKALKYDCARFGYAMNNWNKQHNRAPVCE